MKQSIETIWRQGFLDKNALVAPKINDLYNQKSQNLVDKFHRMFIINRIAIIAGCFIVVSLAILFGVPFLGIFIAALLLWLVWLGNEGMRDLELLDKNVDSYHYLKSFSDWHKQVEARYIKAYTYFYPLFFLSFAVRYLLSADAHAIFKNILLESPETFTIVGIPWYFIGLTSLIVLLLGYFGGALYKIDVDVVYGNAFRKLDQLISEMEQLRDE